MVERVFPTDELCHGYKAHEYCEEEKNILWLDVFVKFLVKNNPKLIRKCTAPFPSQQMMEAFEADLQSLLDGKPIEEGPIDVIVNESFRPVTKKSVGYIVCGVVINDDNEVLMMQEAKPSRAGTWYLPAGRLEPNETLQEGVQREVLEETGLKFEPTSLLCVEVARGHWFRFTFIGSVSGGTLKTLEEQDAESMQGKWCPVGDVHPDNPDLPLRALDILTLLESAVRYREAEVKPPPVLPLLNPHTRLLLRTVLISQGGNSISILYGKTPSPHFPQITVAPGIVSIQVPIIKLVQRIYKSVLDLRPCVHGILSVEYNGKPAKEHDGVCITVLVTLLNKNGKTPDVESNEDFEWCVVSSEELSKAVIERKDLCVPLIDL